MLLAASTDGRDGVEDAGHWWMRHPPAWRSRNWTPMSAWRVGRRAPRAPTRSGAHRPTGTNVGDLVIGLKLAAAAARALPGLRGGASARVL
jgi:hypothetical protein